MQPYFARGKECKSDLMQIWIAVVFPQAQDDTQLLTATVFFSEETARNLAKECTLNQRYGYENSKRVFCAGENCGEKKCYPRENSGNA